MSSQEPPSSRETDPPPFHAEVLLLPDGRVLVHNLTPEFARVLGRLGMLDSREGKAVSSLPAEALADAGPKVVPRIPPLL